MAKSLIELRAKIREGFERMEAVRADVRNRLHAGGMEEWAEWHKLEPQVLELELGVTDISEDLGAAVENLVAKLSKLRDDLFYAATTPSTSRILQLGGE